MDEDTAPSPADQQVAAPGRTRRDAVLNRQRVLAAARRLLARQGAAGLTMDAVALEAGVGKGTVFRRFGDRDGLIRTLIDEEMAQFQAAFLTGPPPLGPGAGPIERLEAFISEMIAVEDRHVELLLAANPRRLTDVSDIYQTMHTHLQDLVRAVRTNEDPDVLATLLLGAVAPTVLHHLRHTMGLSVAEVQRAALSLIRGLRERDGSAQT